MKKSYFLKYGSTLPKAEIKALLDEQWDISCEEHESIYLGIYFLYRGLYADNFTITDNYILSNQEWLDRENAKYNTLINISFIHGKNKDKLSKCKFMKDVMSQFDNVYMIDEKRMEEI